MAAGARGILEQEVERARTAAQRRRRRAFRLGVAAEAPARGRAPALRYLYKQGDLLVGDADLDRVERLLTSWDVGHEVVDGLIGGVTVLSAEGDHEQLLDRLDAALGIGVVTPNHVLDVQAFKSLCPATEPEPATLEQRWPAVEDTDLGRDVRVAVIDTGFLPDLRSRSLPWLSRVDRFDVDDDAYDPKVEGRLQPYGGHGTFTVGTLLSVAPGVTASVDDALVGGVVDEATIVRQVHDALGDSPDVISISAGTYTRHNIPPKALAALWDHRLRHHKGVAVVAAAGNDGGRTPFWPAAFPWVLAVGSLSKDGSRRSPWTNHGGWVDVYAPGEDVVNAYPNGTYRTLDGRTRRFRDTMARWSGTSFATPIVAGLVARHMGQTGVNGVQAAKDLRRLAQQQFLPGVGARLLP